MFSDVKTHAYEHDADTLRIDVYVPTGLLETLDDEQTERLMIRASQAAHAAVRSETHGEILYHG